jgi:hypothetical protein
VKSTGELLAIREPAPWLGQHTDEVLRDIGYDEGAVQALYAAGVLYDQYREAAPQVRESDRVTAQ